MAGYDAVLFDNDGVLVEPPDSATQAAAARRAYASLDVHDPPTDHVEEIIAGATPERLAEIGEFHGVDPHDLWAARERHDEESQLSAFRAGERTVYDDVAPTLADLPVPAGVVSNNHHGVVEFVLDHFDLGAHVDVYHGRERGVENLRRKKPDPHYVERALAAFEADSALMVGDRGSDVRAAHAAGIDSALLRRPDAARVEAPADPTHEVRSLTELPGLLTG
jgi:HAD superfamily hydrolase (TIGR01549 family)